VTDPREGLSVTSFAKINRTLRVLGRRPDGFHELDTVFQTVDLTEEIEFFLESEEGSAKISLEIEGADLPADDGNLILKAARALATHTGARRGARIHLSKKIPIGGGMGGGSSNAAATLRALSELWNLSLTQSELLQIAASLGSDVPFFLLGGRARGRGRGEVLTPMPDGPQEWLLLVLPPFSLSTAEVYGRVRARALTGSPSATKVSGSDIGGGPERNDLEQAAESLRGELRRIRSALAGAGARSARLSGSGSTVFGTFGTKEAASKAMTSLEGLANETKARMAIVKTVSRAEFARRAAPVRIAQRG
jgi:4-diphosphocytidyl-2-C-methyl-D-erythritol kinase